MTAHPEAGSRLAAADALAEAARKYLGSRYSRQRLYEIAEQELSAAIAAYDAATKDDGWLPMETAPRDPLPGRRTRWLHLFGGGQGFMECDVIGYWDTEEQWWVDAHSKKVIRPTHWRLLPPPPRSDTGEE